MDASEGLATTVAMESTIQPLIEEEWPNNGNFGGAVYYSDEIAMFQFTTDIDLYALSVIIFLGLPGNIIGMSVFMTRTFRHTSCRPYLVVKSASDAIFLICAFVVWLERVNIYALHTQGVCQSVVYFTYVSVCISVWCAVAIALENLLKSRHPYKVATFCTLPRRSCALVAVVMICALYIPSIWINRVDELLEYQVCHQNPKETALRTVYTYLDNIITLIIPSAAILIMLPMTFHAISKAKKRRMYNGGRRHRSKRVTMQRKMTGMLSAVTVSFMVMTLPRHITRITLMVMVWTGEVPELTAAQYITHHVFRILYYLSFSVNILTYVIFCRRFRSTLFSCSVSLVGFKNSSVLLKEMPPSYALSRAGGGRIALRPRTPTPYYAN